MDWYQWNFPPVSQLQNDFLLILKCSDWRCPEGRGRWEWLLVPVALQGPMLQARLCLAGECGCLDLSCGCMPVTIEKWGTALELQKPTSCLRRREEKTAMYVIDTRLYTRAINSESFPLLCCLNYCWGGVREGEWLLCCIFAQKPSHRGSMEKVLTSAGSTQH